VYTLATLLDPRYKGRLFAPDEPPPAKKARAGPLDVLDAILGAPCSAHLIRISRVTGGCSIVRVSAARRYQSSGIAD